MKKLFAVTMAVFLLISCGKPKDADVETNVPTATEADNSILYQPFSEADLALFIKVAPVVKEEIKKADKEMEVFGEAKDIGSAIGRYATINKDIATLDAKLKVYGTNWQQFWPTFGRVTMAVVAVTLDDQMEELKKGFKEIEAQLNNPQIPKAQKEMLLASKNAMTQLQAVYDQVPAGNKDLVRKNWDKLAEILEIND